VTPRLRRSCDDDLARSYAELDLEAERLIATRRRAGLPIRARPGDPDERALRTGDWADIDDLLGLGDEF